MPKKDVSEQVEAAEDRFSVMKKAGLPLPLVVALTIMSTPGFYSMFFDNTGEVAEKKADVTYEVVAKEIEHLRDDDKDLERELQRAYRDIASIRQMILILYARGSVDAASLDDVLGDVGVSEAAGDGGGTGIPIGIGIGSTSAPANLSGVTLTPPEVLEQIIEQNQQEEASVSDPVGQRDALPSKLESLL